MYLVLLYEDIVKGSKELVYVLFYNVCFELLF